jgi:hypothetical protein
MKKKSIPIGVTVVLAVVGMLVLAGCKDDPPPVEHTDPSFLVGTWTNSDKGITFVIDLNLGFTCNLTSIMSSTLVPATVTGNLGYDNPDLGPNDYLLLNMTTPVVGQSDPNFQGNEGIRTTVEGLSASGLIGTLTPSSDKQQFTFTSTDQTAGGFFGGTYSKQQP